jgi:hypothetical protein
MRGSNIKNIYIIDGGKFAFNELDKEQVSFIENAKNIPAYNLFRNNLIEKYGDDVEAVIEIQIPSFNFIALNKNNIRIL